MVNLFVFFQTESKTQRHLSASHFLKEKLMHKGVWDLPGLVKMGIQIHYYIESILHRNQLKGSCTNYQFVQFPPSFVHLSKEI